MKYGTHPMPDSAEMNFSFGCLRRMPENSSVATVAMFDEGAMQPPRVRRAPLLDEPVVERADQRERVRLVLDLDEREAGQAGKRRERDLHVDAVDVHVLEPLPRVVATGAHGVEGLRLRREL